MDAARPVAGAGDRSACSLPSARCRARSRFGGAWYFVAGFAVLLLASQSHALSPWTMGLPFVIGQLLMAAILHFASGDDDVED